MAEQQTESTQPAPEQQTLTPVENDEIKEFQELKRDVERVSVTIHHAIESDLPPGIVRDDLHGISDVLGKVESSITEAIRHLVEKQGDEDSKKDEQLLPPSKREELRTLLHCIERALRPPRRPEPERPLQKKVLSVTGCNPFKPWSSSSQQEGGGGGGEGGQEEDDEAVSTKLLLRLAQQVLEPEKYYVWTTSYVDESRLYGWDEDAGRVVDALVGPRDGDFRAAAIAGVHGSGKTALAQKAFVHDRVKDHFPLRLWVCVGPPDSEDRFCLLYRMLDNLGLDTNKIEDVVVDRAEVVIKHREEEREKIPEGEIQELRKKAADKAAREAKNNNGAQSQQKPAGDDKDAQPGDVEDGAKKEQSNEDDAVERCFQELLKERLDDTPAVHNSKIGVLLYILHVTLSKTGYLIVFDDIRVYGDDGWYSNLTLPPPPPDQEWGDRLAYGLPKTGKHRSAVLLTCRKEDDAKAMVRAGRVFHPPELTVDDGWKLFTREYQHAKEQKKKKKKKEKEEEDGSGGGEAKEEEGDLLKDLEGIKTEIVKKCLGLPIAIIEAARGFSELKRLPDGPVVEKAPEKKPSPKEDKPAKDQSDGSNKDAQGEEDDDADE